MERPLEPTLTAARDTLATAAVLGLPIPAPPGTIVYTYWYRSYRSGMRGPEEEFNEHGIYSSSDGALAALAQHLIDVHDERSRVRGAPWGCKGFYDSVTHEQWVSDMPGWIRKEREAQDRARDEWVSSRTPSEIVEALLGPNRTPWKILRHTLQP